MKQFKFEANVKYNYGDTVYVTTSGRKTWFKGTIIGWKLGRPSYPIEFSNENDEEHYQKYPLPISYIVLIKDQNGESKKVTREAATVYDKPAEEDIKRLKKLREEKEKIEKEIARIESYI